MFSCLFLLLLPPQEIEDRHFISAQEQWVHSQKLVTDLDQVLPARQATLVRDLACEHYSCRQNAQEILLSQGVDSVKAAVWGSYHKNPEIANRCRHILTELLVCPHCHGEGVCSVKAEHEYNTYDRCKICQKICLYVDADEYPDAWTIFWDSGCVVCAESGTLYNPRNYP